MRTQLKRTKDPYQHLHRRNPVTAGAIDRKPDVTKMSASTDFNTAGEADPLNGDKVRTKLFVLLYTSNFKE